MGRSHSLDRRRRPCRSSTVSPGSLASVLWISARAELEALVGVMILTESDWARPWLPGVLASDASLVTEKHRVSGIPLK